MDPVHDRLAEHRSTRRDRVEVEWIPVSRQRRESALILEAVCASSHHRLALPGMVSPFAMAMGSLCISIDVELAWGIWDKPSPDYHARCARGELTVVERLLALFDARDIAATWA